MEQISKKKNILLIEDEASTLRIIGDTLERAGFEVMKAMDGFEGLRMAGDIPPDLILLDILMPDMDGIEVLKRLRSEMPDKDIPVIMLTNLSDMEKIHEALEAGAKDYIVKKDIKLAGLVQKVRESLE